MIDKLKEIPEIILNYSEEREKRIQELYEATIPKTNKLIEEFVEKLPKIKDVSYVINQNILESRHFFHPLCTIVYKDTRINTISFCSRFDDSISVRLGDTSYPNMQKLCVKIKKTVKSKIAQLERNVRLYTLEDLQKELDAIEDIKKTFEKRCLDRGYYLNINPTINPTTYIQIELPESLCDKYRLEQIKKEIQAGITREKFLSNTRFTKSRFRLPKYNIRCSIEDNINGWSRGRVLPSMVKSRVRKIIKNLETK